MPFAMPQVLYRAVHKIEAPTDLDDWTDSTLASLRAAQIGRLAYEFNFWNPQCREFPISLVCEEAHEYIPRGDHPRFKQARRIMERIAKNGRKYGVGLVVVSQRPHDVSETVLAQCGTYVCLRISNPDDQEYVRRMVPEAAPRD